MSGEDEKRIAARLAKVMAMMCVRNTRLEDLHAGLVPVTRTGDYSDFVRGVVHLRLLAAWLVAGSDQPIISLTN
jgi:hypothetical protein